MNELASHTLRIPASWYGPVGEVRRNVRRQVNALVKGAPLPEAVGDVLLDVSMHPGLIVLDRRWSSISSKEPQFHVDLVIKAMAARKESYRAPEPTLLTRVGEQCLTAAWSFAGIMGSQLYQLVRRAAAQLRFLEHASQHWPTLAAAGPRYSQGSSSGEHLESIVTLVAFCLGRQGSSYHPHGQPLTPDVLREHMDTLPGARVRAMLAAGKVDDALEQLRGHAGIPLASLGEHFLDFGHEDAACEVIAGLNAPDPHNIVRDWLAGRGDLSRAVR